MNQTSLDDIAALQGVWVQIGLEVDGVTDPPNGHGPNGVRTTFIGHEFFVRDSEGGLILAGRFMLDASTTPRSITWIDSMGPDTGKHLPAIYQLENDRFVFIAADEGAPRPTAFKTGPGQTMRTMRRDR